MTNLVVLCHERYRLTVQCIESIRRNTKEGTYTLTLVDDDSQDFRVRNFLDNQALYHPKDTTVVRVIGSRHCLGALKNLGAMHSELRFGRGEFLCILDNDMYLFPNWNEGWGFSDKNDLAMIGFVRHPFHQPIKEFDGWVETDAVAGYSHMMPWMVWNIFGPYVTDAPGIGQSEDWAFSQKIRKGRPYEPGKGPLQIGYKTPPIATHCGITNSKGESIAGTELIERVGGVLYL